VSGQLQRLFVEIGDYVTEGDLLAEIDARVQEARVNASRANIESLEVQLDARREALKLAHSNVERQTRLLATNVTSQFELDTAKNTVSAAEANLFLLQKQIQQSEASLETEETLLEFTRIYAPMSGTVVAIEMEEGRTLNANQNAPIILRIADLATMTVEANISEADIGDIKAGMDVYFTTLGGRQRRWYSKVRQILPTPVIENNVVLYTGLFDIDNQDSALLPEMTAQVYFVTASARDVLTVPMGALTFMERPERAARVADATANPQAAQQRRTQSLQVATIDGEPQPTGSRREGNARDVGRGERPRRGRPALVTVIGSDGNQRETQIQIGVSSRISAEVISGLAQGDKVVAGIVQNQGANQAQGDGSRRGLNPNFRRPNP